MKQKIIFLIAALLAMPCLKAQNFIQTTDGKCYWTDDEIEGRTEVRVQDGGGIICIPVSDIVSVESMDRGTETLQPNKLRYADAVHFEGYRADFFAAGKRVYIPIASPIVEQRWGARRLCELLMQDGHWTVVGSEEQADFVIEYEFSSKGWDKATLIFRTRTGEIVMRSKAESAHSHDPEEAGKKSAEKLYEKCMLKGAYEGDFRTWVDEYQKAYVRMGIGENGAYVGGGQDGEIFVFLHHIEGMITCQYSAQRAFGVGLSVEGEIYTEGKEYFSYVPLAGISPQIEFIRFFPRHHSNPTFLRLKLGWIIPVEKRKDERSWTMYYYDGDYAQYKYYVEHHVWGPNITFSYGRRWIESGIWMEGYAGMMGYRYARGGDYNKYIHLTNLGPALQVGLKLSYSFPNPKL